MKRTTIIAALVLLTASPAWAASASLTANVVRTLIDSQNYGGCMAQVDVSPSGVLAGCKSNWISFSCTGDFNPSEVGYRKLEAAQLALVTETTITATIENTKLHNGYCFARRVDNRAP